MLKITPYIPILVPIVIIGGLFSPLFGYFLLIDMIALMLISPFKGRFFCGNLCSRGILNDVILNKISRLPRHNQKKRSHQELSYSSLIVRAIHPALFIIWKNSRHWVKFYANIQTSLSPQMICTSTLCYLATNL